MEQRDIDEAEWKNPDNWTGPGLFSFYFSKRDSRTWVPKSLPWMGWTLNLGKPEGARWMIFLLVGVPTLIILFVVGASILCTTMMALG